MLLRSVVDRSGKCAKRTDAGRSLVERGRSLLDEAESLWNCVKRVAHGWELQLTLAIGEIVPLEPIFPLIAEFDRHGNGTRIRLTRETFGGAWDALIDRRADLSIGAAGDKIGRASCRERVCQYV